MFNAEIQVVLEVFPKFEKSFIEKWLQLYEGDVERVCNYLAKSPFNCDNKTGKFDNEIQIVQKVFPNYEKCYVERWLQLYNGDVERVCNYFVNSPVLNFYDLQSKLVEGRPRIGDYFGKEITELTYSLESIKMATSGGKLKGCGDCINVTGVQNKKQGGYRKTGSMPSALSRPLEQICLCGNDDPLKIRQYRYPRTDEFLGIYCELCKKEWLSESVLDSTIFECDGEFQLGRRTLKHFKVPAEEGCGCNLPVGPRTKIDDLSMIKEGDQFAFDRPYTIWHHGIVDQVDKANNRIEVYEWTSGLSHNGVRKVWIDLETQKGPLYRIDYDEAVAKANPLKLVIARAHSFIIRNIKGNIFTQNCEHFARFCKVGMRESIQLNNLVNNAVRAVSKAIGKSFPRIPLVYGAGEGIEILTKGSQVVGACVVVAFEGFFMCLDIHKIYSQRKSGGISFMEFIKTTISRISEAVFSASCTVGAGILGETVGSIVGTAIFPGVGTIVGAVIGGVVGGSIGSLVGHMLGNPFGEWMGGLIVKHIKRDDTAVLTISQLSPGDQIVLYGHPLHPRHHVIVIEHDGISKIHVIHNTHTHGVIEEWIDFVKPVYNVVYSPDTQNDAEETLRRACSKIGQPNKYSLVTNNCKDFAQWCKECQK